jgi:hypothetical protein
MRIIEKLVEGEGTERSVLTRENLRTQRKLRAGVFGSTFVGSLLAELGPKLSPLTPVGEIFQAFYIALTISLIATGVAQLACRILDLR